MRFRPVQGPEMIIGASEIDSIDLRDKSCNLQNILSHSEKIPAAIFAKAAFFGKLGGPGGPDFQKEQEWIV
jgi:hypothetical protein